MVTHLRTKHAKLCLSLKIDVRLFLYLATSLHACNTISLTLYCVIVVKHDSIKISSKYIKYRPSPACSYTSYAKRESVKCSGCIITWTTSLTSFIASSVTLFFRMFHCLCLFFFYISVYFLNFVDFWWIVFYVFSQGFVSIECIT